MSRDFPCLERMHLIPYEYTPPGVYLLMFIVFNLNSIGTVLLIMFDEVNMMPPMRYGSTGRTVTILLMTYENNKIVTTHPFKMLSRAKWDTQQQGANKIVCFFL